MAFKGRLNTFISSKLINYAIRASLRAQNGGKTLNPDSTVTKIIKEFKDRNRADIDKWRKALELATHPENPRLYVLQDLYDNLQSDGHYISQINLRKAATLCNDFSIIDKTTGDVNSEKTELFNAEWFYNFVDSCLDSVVKGYTLFELINPDTMEFAVFPRRNLQPTFKRILLKATDDRFIDYSTGFDDRFIHVGKTDSLGLLSDLCGQLIWKRNAQQSWAEYAEKYGDPLITATTNKTNQSELDNIEAMLIALGEAARAVLPEGTTIDVKPFSGSDSYKVYDNLIERANSEISKPLTGGTMVSDNGSSRAQSEVHERNLDDKISEQDRKMIEFVVNGQLLHIMQIWGHDINPETDKFMYDPSFELSLKEHWEIVNSALDHFEIPIEWISKKFNMPIDGVKKIQPAFQASNKNQFVAKWK